MTKTILAGALILAAMADGAWAQAKPASIAIGVQVIPNDELLAKAQGWYEKELGVKVEFKQFDSGRDVNTAFASGSLDFGLVGSTPTAVGISRGLAYQVFWIHDLIGTAEALAVKNKADVQKLADLKGKKVAVPFGSTTHYSLLSALKLEGVAASDVTILDLQPPEIFAAWQRGDIDAAYVWQPTLGKLLADGKVLTDSSVLASKGIVTADLGLVSTAFAQKYPDFVTKYVRIQDKAYQLFKAQPDAASALLAQGLGTDNAEALKEAKELVWLSVKDEISPAYLGTAAQKGDLAKTLKSTADFLAAQKLIDAAPELAVFQAAVAPQFAEAAAKK